MNDSSKYLTVTALTRYIKYKIDSDEHLRQVFLRGEISNFKSHTTGHLYFSLKDETSKINAIMFNTNAKKIEFKPADGMKVLIVGRISVYEATGNYQIYVDEMIQDGVGNLYLEFEKLKKKLAEEGLFDKSKKKSIPLFPEKIGIVTAPTGAAIKDILSTIKRRYPVCKTYLFPSLVQGEFAKDDIVKKIKLAQTYDLDVLIVGRGGGSIEDLWPFNEEVVERAIFDCKIPVISAVGHETDFTIADFVADLRAPTPSAAAELAVPNISDVLLKLKSYNNRYRLALKKKVDFMKLSYEKCMNRRAFREPLQTVNERYILLDKNVKSIQNEIMSIYKDKKSKAINTIEKLDALSPLKTLTRGYSITEMNGKVVKSVKELKENDEINIRFKDGETKAKIV